MTFGVHAPTIANPKSTRSPVVPMKPFLVAAFYKFMSFDTFADVQAPLLEKCKVEGVIGIILLAREGINGTIAGTDEGIANVLNFLHSDPRVGDFPHKESRADKPPFKRIKVRLKKEIVTMGVEDINPNKIVGTYVDAAAWNELISDPDVILVDTRNDYEVEIGTFKGAANPDIRSFREFPDWAQRNGLLDGQKKVAMFCTGGIRCEKSTAYLRQQGVDEVYHLDGGILKYLETVPEEESLWDGECFVFDKRVSVGHGLKPGPYSSCVGCGRPVSEADRSSPLYERDVCCPRCHADITPEQRHRFTQRRDQMDRARTTASQ